MKNNESVTNVARVRGSSCVGSDTFSSELNHIAHFWTFLPLITFPTLKTHSFSAVQIWSFPSYLVFSFTFFRFVDYITWTALSQLQMTRRATCLPSTTELCLRVPTHMPIAFKLTEGSFSFRYFGLAVVFRMAPCTNGDMLEPPEPARPCTTPAVSDADRPCP